MKPLPTPSTSPSSGSNSPLKSSLAENKFKPDLSKRTVTQNFAVKSDGVMRRRNISEAPPVTRVNTKLVRSRSDADVSPRSSKEEGDEPDEVLPPTPEPTRSVEGTRPQSPQKRRGQIPVHRSPERAQAPIHMVLPPHMHGFVPRQPSESMTEEDSMYEESRSYDYDMSGIDEDGSYVEDGSETEGDDFRSRLQKGVRSQGLVNDREGRDSEDSDRGRHLFCTATEKRGQLQRGRTQRTMVSCFCASFFPPSTILF
jgi:hypothetical protein